MSEGILLNVGANSGQSSSNRERCLSVFPVEALPVSIVVFVRLLALYFKYRLARGGCVGFLSVRGTSGTEPRPCYRSCGELEFFFSPSSLIWVAQSRHCR